MASFEKASLGLAAARTAAFAAIGAGGAGCLLVGPLFDTPELLVGVCVLWGFAVVTDSTQFSAAVTEPSPPELTGTSLTMQACIGCLLTMVTIALVPVIQTAAGCGAAMAILVLGPIFGIVGMIRLRTLPDASRLADGQR